MRLIVDANILVAALLKKATTREILLTSDLEFFTPEHLFFEIKGLVKNKRFRKRLGVSDHELRELLTYLVQPIAFFPEERYLSHIRQALTLVAHDEDAPYIALALALKAPLWSNDAALKKQKFVKVYTTSELVAHLSRKPRSQR